MIIFKREIENQIINNLFKGGMVIILGPRQSGKTTLSQKIIKTFGSNGAYFNCEFAEVRKHFVVGEPDQLLGLIREKKIVVLDEAQTIQNIGKILKVFHDTYPQIQIIATGSSSFDLANKIKEPMTGRAFEFILPPLSVSEIKNYIEISQNKLEEIMLYGCYPAVIGAETIDQKKFELKKIATNYLYKDVYMFESIHNPKVFEDLLLHLAYATGSTVSVYKLGKDLGVAPSTIERYIRLLEQSYVIKRIYSYSRNFANELKKSYKVYFFDTGVRNAIVSSFEFDNKTRGTIFENLFFIEKMKKGFLEAFPPRLNFWRTKQGLEIDLIEERDKKIIAYECKLTDDNVSFSKFIKYYPDAETNVVTLKNFVTFLE
jgi:predicted AAA+ superfamily ATPase